MKYEHHLPADIEQASMRMIAAEFGKRGIAVSEENRAVVMRAIHATADFDYAENLVFTLDAVKHGIAALSKGAALITDTDMALAGVNKKALDVLSCHAVCYMAKPHIAEAARTNETTRAAASVAYGACEYPKAVFAVGNAPTALIKLAELIEDGLRPSLVVAVPVGFVNVVESKEEILRVCRKYSIPAIVAMGRKGGSNVAAAICNALLYAASGLSVASSSFHASCSQRDSV